MWPNGSKWFAFWAGFETKQRIKEALRILLSEIDPYTLKVGDLSGDLSVLPLSRYHYYSINYTGTYNAVSTFTIVICASSI